MTIVVTVNNPLNNTYGELLSDVADWMARDDLSDQIRRFVQSAQSDICKDIRVRGMEKTITYSVGAVGSQTLPTDFKGARRLWVDAETRTLDFLPPERFYNSRINGTSGNPIAYTIEGESIIFAPTPGSSNPVDIHMAYFGNYATMVALSDTNTLLQEHYDLYLYCALKHGFAYIRDDIQAAKFKNEYEQMVRKVNRNDNRDRFHGNVLKRYVASAP